MLRVPTPQTGRAIDVDVSIHVGEAASRAPLITAGPARFTGAARQEHFDCDPIPPADTPPFCSTRPDLLDDTDRLVAGNERVTREQLAGELLVIGTAEAASLDAQQPVVVADRGQRNLT